MRLASRLIVNYLVVLGLVALLLTAAVPRIVRAVVLDHAGQLLARQATLLARGATGGTPRAVAARGTSRLLAAHLLLVDSGGSVIQVISDNAALRNLTGNPLGPELTPPFQTALRTNAAQVGEFGRDWVVAVAPLPAGSRSEAAAMMLMQPVRDLEAGMRWATRRVLFVTLGGVLLALLLSGVMAADMARRLGHLRRAATAIAGGNLAGRMPVEGRDEIADVADSFNHMADRVEHLVSGLRRSEQQRRDLVASLAHELRTPVTSMRGFAEALRDGVVQDPEQQRRYHGIIAAESARLGRLIQDLFDLSRAETGQLELRLQPVAATAWLREFVESAHAGVAGRGHDLVLALPDPPPPGGGPAVLADRQRLEQVLHNLVDNALRHSPPGAPVRLELALPPGQVQVAVADRGPGVPPEEAERIWDRFYRSQQGKPGGAGLGLAIVRSIVIAHGGEVGLESRPGEGARFWFTLPLTQP